LSKALISNRDIAKTSEGAEGVTFFVCPSARFARNFAQAAPARSGSALRLAQDEQAKSVAFN
jgi:hypothetical protein